MTFGPWPDAGEKRPDGEKAEEMGGEDGTVSLEDGLARMDSDVFREIFWPHPSKREKHRLTSVALALQYNRGGQRMNPEGSHEP